MVVRVSFDRAARVAAPRARGCVSATGLGLIALWGLSGCSVIFYSRVGTGTAVADTVGAVVLAGGAEGLALATGHAIGGASLTPSTWTDFGLAAMVVGSVACIASATWGFTHRRASPAPPRQPDPAPTPPLDPAGRPPDAAPP